MSNENGQLREISRNKIKALIAYTARTVALTCASGPLMQTFLSIIGFESDLIYVHTSILQVANVLTIVLFSEWVSGKNPIKRSSFALLPTGILFLVYLPIAIVREASAAVYVILCAIGVAQQISIGLFTVCEYKVPYYIYRADEYGFMLSVCGIVSSLLSLGTGAVISYFTTRFHFASVMAFAFTAAALLIFVAVICIYLEKSLIAAKAPTDKPQQKSRLPLITLFKLPIFSTLIHANLLRGFAAGIIGVLATIALDLGHSETVTSAMVSVSSAASLIACTIFAISARRISPRLMLLIGSTIILTLPLMLNASSVAFTVLFFVITIGRTLIDYSVPSILIKSVSLEIAGSYHAWRLVLQNAGTLIATAVAALLPIPMLLILSAIFQIISGISFAIATKKAERAAKIPSFNHIL